MSTIAQTPRYEKLVVEDLEVGDHIIQPGAFGVEDLLHHALYVGKYNGQAQVLHYYGNPYMYPSLFSKMSCEVRLDSLDTLVKAANAMDTQLFVQIHENPMYTGNEVVERALKRLGENDYNLLINNCEHLVNWAIENQPISMQIETL